MPAKKSATVVMPTAMPTAMPGQFQFPQNFQFGVPQMPMTPPMSFQPLATSAPFQSFPAQPVPLQPASLAAHSIPMAQPVATPVATTPAVESGMTAVETLEAQMKMMKDYLTTMEKTFKEAKKGMKKPKVPKDPNAPKNPIPEGTQAWNDFVVLVQKEESDRIRATDPTKPADWKGISRKEAMAKAKELKAAGDPRYNYVKKEKPATASAVPAISAIQPGAPIAVAEPKKRGRKPKSATTVVPPPALPPTAVPSIPTASFTFPTFASALPPTTQPAEESVEVEEIVINGANYLMTAKKECWHMLPNGDQGDWAGLYNGSIIVPAPEPK
jgi:hypothetical protein